MAGESRLGSGAIRANPIDASWPNPQIHSFRDAVSSHCSLVSIVCIGKRSKAATQVGCTWRPSGPGRRRTERAPLAGRRHHAHIAIVTRRGPHADAGRHFVRAIHQYHLSRVHQRIVIRVVVADAVADVPLVGVLPLGARGEVAGARKRGNGRAILQDGIAAAVVPMQVAVDHDIDLIGIDAVARQRSRASARTSRAGLPARAPSRPACRRLPFPPGWCGRRCG